MLSQCTVLGYPWPSTTLIGQGVDHTGDGQPVISKVIFLSKVDIYDVFGCMMIGMLNKQIGPEYIQDEPERSIHEEYTVIYVCL